MSLLFDYGDTQNALSLVAKNRSIKVLEAVWRLPLWLCLQGFYLFFTFLKLALQESVRAISTARLNTSP